MSEFPTAGRGATFAEPWQARAFALAVSLTDEEADDAQQRYRWSEFQSELISEIDVSNLDLDHEAIHTPDDVTQLDAEEDRYYSQWLSALEHLLTREGAIDEAALRDRALDFSRGERDAHEFVDGDPREHADRLPEGHADGGDHEHGHDHDHSHGHDDHRHDDHEHARND